MFFNLLEQEDFESLPTEAGPRWVALEELARARMKAALDTMDKDAHRKPIILQYMKVVQAAAENLGIEDLKIPGSTDPTANLLEFTVAVQAAAARIWVSTIEPSQRIGLKVSKDAKASIRSLVNEIFVQIPNLELIDRQEIRLRKSLTKFVEELEMPNSRFSVGSAHLVIALTVLNLAVTTTAASTDALEAIKRIQSIWGEEYEKSESDRMKLPYDPPVGLLPPPPKAISGPRTKEQ